MTRENPITRAQGILAVLRNHPDGASLEQIASKMQPAPPNRRALQRWLLDLIEQGRVVRTGKARASRYTLAASTSAKRDHWAYASEAEYITPGKVTAGGPISGPLSVPMAKLLKLMEAYNPNTSFYLDEPLRAQLYAAGTSHKTDTTSKRWLVELAWNSCRLDGNTYSLPDAEALLLTGRWAAEKSTYEAQMLLNHLDAIEFLTSSMVEPNKDHHARPNVARNHLTSDAPQFDAYTLLNAHALLADNLLPSSNQQTDEYFNLFLTTAAEISDPFEQAFFAWLHLSHLQPFEGMNAPLARLAANIPLIHNSLQPLLFTDVPQNLYSQTMLNVYEPYQIESLRELFVWAYKRSCNRQAVLKNGIGLPDPFKIQYKQAISNAVSDAVLGKINNSEIAAFAKQFSTQYVAENDQRQFAQVITQELTDLNVGNIARFKLKPSDFKAWKAVF